IDVDAVVDFCKKEYENAGLKPEDIDTGAVIVTGETAKKQNADEIVERLSSESGKFVSATAGPNFESVLGAMGSGVVDLTILHEKTYMNVDIGGGTSNIAIATKGDIHSTSCINVGGRLLCIKPDNEIWRIDEPTEFLMKELEMKYKLGDIITDKDIKKIVNKYAKALVEVMIGPAKSTIAKGIMMTDDLDFSIPVDGYSFSGGVAEVIYNEKNIVEYNDIGILLAKEIRRLMKKEGLPLIEPENKIRATVIGAGAFSLSVSGSTCYYEKSVALPILNVPVVSVNIDQRELHLIDKKLKSAINLALKNFDLIEGEDRFALYFKTPFMRAQIMEKFASALKETLPKSVAKKKLILIILAFDGAKVLGITIRENTPIKSNLFCLDELDLEAGDWIDIGESLKTGDVFPVTVKSLVFNKNKER
ncbi:MAG: ethanolamine ammonia-lyase reactivating factor EutA, partial [Candidatus Heimdallarchaeota archaeon]